MKNKIATGGFWRLKNAQKKLTLEALHQKYAREISKATTEQKRAILDKIEEEFNRQKNHTPSASTLY